MIRCELCGVPMAKESATGYCSERCLMWDFFGVPALKEQDFIAEIRANQNGDPRTHSVEAYPGLFTDEEERTIVEALALLKITCNEIRSDG